MYRHPIAYLLITVLALASSELGANGFTRILNTQPSSLERFTPDFPEMNLINQDGDQVPLDTLLGANQNVLFAFFFTQCITICTTTTFNMKSVSEAVPGDTTLALISIDPDNDTPSALKEYARKFGLESDRWQLLTGSRADLETFQRTLDSYRGNKMNHNTSIFLKKAGSPVITEVPDNFRIIPQLLQQ